MARHRLLIPGEWEKALRKKRKRRRKNLLFPFFFFLVYIGCYVDDRLMESVGYVGLDGRISTYGDMEGEANMAATTTSGEVFWSSLHHNTADDCCNPAGADDYCMDDDNYDEETYCPYVYSMEGDPVNWQERCIELEMSLQRFRDQAGKIRGLLREKVSHNQSTVSFHLVLLCCGRRNSGRFPRGLLLFFFFFFLYSAFVSIGRTFRVAILFRFHPTGMESFSKAH